MSGPRCIGILTYNIERRMMRERGIDFGDDGYDFGEDDYGEDYVEDYSDPDSDSGGN